MATIMTKPGKRDFTKEEVKQKSKYKLQVKLNLESELGSQLSKNTRLKGNNLYRHSYSDLTIEEQFDRLKKLIKQRYWSAVVYAFIWDKEADTVIYEEKGPNCNLYELKHP